MSVCYILDLVFIQMLDLYFMLCKMSIYIFLAVQLSSNCKVNYNLNRYIVDFFL
jgi:hypothetical protein